MGTDVRAVPVPVAVVEPSELLPQRTVTVSPGENPWHDTLTVLPPGPVDGESEQPTGTGPDDTYSSTPLQACDPGPGSVDRT
jgi:hypothetical protein